MKAEILSALSARPYKANAALCCKLPSSLLIRSSRGMSPPACVTSVNPFSLKIRVTPQQFSFNTIISGEQGIGFHWDSTWQGELLSWGDYYMTMLRLSKYSSTVNINRGQATPALTTKLHSWTHWHNMKPWMLLQKGFWNALLSHWWRKQRKLGAVNTWSVRQSQQCYLAEQVLALKPKNSKSTWTIPAWLSSFWATLPIANAAISRNCRSFVPSIFTRGGTAPRWTILALYDASTVANWPISRAASLWASWHLEDSRPMIGCRAPISSTLLLMCCSRLRVSTSDCLSLDLIQWIQTSTVWELSMPQPISVQVCIVCWSWLAQRNCKINMHYLSKNALLMCEVTEELPC